MTKVGGDQSMAGKREAPEDVYAAAPQDPRGTVKARQPESQSPAVKVCAPRYHVHQRGHRTRPPFQTTKVVILRAMGEDQ